MPSDTYSIHHEFHYKSLGNWLNLDQVPKFSQQMNNYYNKKYCIKKCNYLKRHKVITNYNLISN